jgi:hypothetical protein
VKTGSWDSAVGIRGCWIKAGRPRGRNSSPGKGRIFLLSTSSIPAHKPTKLPFQWVPSALSPGESGRGVNLTTRIHLVPRLRMAELCLHAPICLHGVVHMDNFPLSVQVNSPVMSL